MSGNNALIRAAELIERLLYSGRDEIYDADDADDICARLREMAERADIDSEDRSIEALSKQESSNYCRILTALGCEEEGDPVAEVEKFIARIAEQENAISMRDDELTGMRGMLDRSHAYINKCESGRETLCVRIGQLEAERERLHRLLREWVDTTYAPEDDGGAELLRKTVEALKANDNV